MSEREQKTRPPGGREYSWDRFRRVCALSALSKATPCGAGHAFREGTPGISPEELQDDLRQQYELQHSLALEFANALSELQDTQQRIKCGPRPDLDAHLEAQVLELAICEEAYEIVCEEVDCLRQALEHSKAPVE